MLDVLPIRRLESRGEVRYGGGDNQSLMLYCRNECPTAVVKTCSSRTYASGRTEDTCGRTAYAGDQIHISVNIRWYHVPDEMRHRSIIEHSTISWESLPLSLAIKPLINTVVRQYAVRY